jgi:chemotaxis protein MotB
LVIRLIGAEHAPSFGPEVYSREESMNFTSRVSSGRPTRLAVAATMAMLGAGVVLMNGCVSSGRYTEVEQDRDLLSTSNENLKKSLEELNQKSEALAQERTALAAEKADLEGRLAQVESREQALGMKLQESEDESRKLKGTYDGLLSSLQKELKAGQIQVKQLRDGLSVNVAQDILFDSGSAALDENGKEVLQRVAVQLKKSNYQVVVTGHTDNKPIGAGLVKRYPTNWELAAARSASVVRLFAHSGLASSRLLVASVADNEPVAANNTAEGRAKNRRIEIRLRPVVKDK